MKINKSIRLLCSWHTIQMLDASGKRHLRETALAVGVQAVEGHGARVQRRTEGAWSRTSGHFISSERILRQAASGVSQGNASGKHKHPSTGISSIFIFSPALKFSAIFSDYEGSTLHHR